MFRIGDFSRLCQVSIRMLRYYDELGLLKPAHIDRFTGYRYYTIAQLPRLNRILALRDLDFSLEQIALLINDELPAEYLRAMLETKQTELEQRIQDEQARLMRVAARLRQIEREGAMPEFEVVVKKVAPQTVVSARKAGVDSDGMRAFWQTVAVAVEKVGIKTTGDWLSIYHHTDFREKDMDVEIAVPVDPVSAAQCSERSGGLLHVSTLPGVETTASLTYEFSQDKLIPAYQAIGAWLDNNGYTIVGPSREVHLDGQGGPCMDEIQFPVMKSAAGCVPTRRLPVNSR